MNKNKTNEIKPKIRKSLKNFKEIYIYIYIYKLKITNTTKIKT